MIDSKIKNFNEFEKVNEAAITDGKNYYECYLVTFTAYEDNYEEGENTKPYTYETVEEDLKSSSLENLLNLIATNYSHWIPEPINKQTAYYENSCIRCSFGPVNRDWKPLSKSEEAAWKEGTFTAYATYVDLYIHKTTDIPNAEAFKLVGKP